MELKEKVEEDYKKIKIQYQSQGTEQVYQQSGIIARKNQIYLCCIRQAELLERIPLLNQSLLKEANLIDAIDRFYVPDRDVEWKVFLWMESQMETERQRIKKSLHKIYVKKG